MSSLEFVPPTEFHDYRVIRPLGKGGMGRVYLGYDLLLDRSVAIKFIADDLPTAHARQRFHIEAVALARLQHPNVMAVYRASQVAGRPYIVGELVSGTGLDQIDKPLSGEQVLSIALGLARGLAAAHQRGVLHRDLKLSNAIFTPEGFAKLVDFGIAKLVDDEVAPAAIGSANPQPASHNQDSLALLNQAGSSLGTTASMDSGAISSDPESRPQSSPKITQDGVRLGTPLYMAPEVLRAEPATARSDVYSLGVILYELRHGCHPRQAEVLPQSGQSFMQRKAVPLAALARPVDRRLAAVVDRCMRPEPMERYASGTELCADLEQIVESLNIRRRVLRAMAAMLVVIVGLSIAGNALLNSVRIRRAVSSKLHAAQAAVAQARQCNSVVETLRNQSFAAFDAKEAKAGSARWAEALDKAKQCYVLYQQVTRTLDESLLLDPKRGDVRHQFAEALYEQATLLDRDHRQSQRDEVLARLASYADLEQAEYIKRWNQPGQLSLTTTPAAATVAISRYSSELEGRMSLRALDSLGDTPIHDASLEPGSYLLILTAVGRVPVRLPLLVQRGGRLDVSVYLPAPHEIPPGFVYVPAGQGCFGAAVDEQIRTRILEAVPMHAVSLGSYLISRTETTFTDWLTFLAALPPDIRELHRPRSRTATSQEAFDLRQGPDGIWTLTMSPTTPQRHTAREGEPIIYATRKHRQSIDWRRLPVVGIDQFDAQAYVDWLRETGRVPGARFCTEQEWERAARGADGREYPHGDFLAPDDANIDITYDQVSQSMGPDEVGSHPASRSPFGVDDLSGNVWEMVLSSKVKNKMVLKGGSYYYDPVTAQVDNHKAVEQALRDQRLGFRICANFRVQEF